ncbi:hypothetical protein A9Q84_00075 [Halobacteriovorax marinus]|uniref:Transmembrane protein n=1 Tax=Halobacteriovorax marinus TaxID=97084 RepID=A0A1Y5FIT2_9BACT|nr:hypothetical protein A9Q84_00075 [Halobacteriovorax marinus]
MQNPNESLSQDPWKFGGWLLVLGFAVHMGVLISIMELYDVLYKFNKLSIENKSFFVYFELIAHLIIFTIRPVAAYRFWNKEKSFKVIFLASLIAPLLIILSEVSLAYLLLPKGTALVLIDHFMRYFIGGICALTIWATYLKKSTRVKRTFIN